MSSRSVFATFPKHTIEERCSSPVQSHALVPVRMTLGSLSPNLPRRSAKHVTCRALVPHPTKFNRDLLSSDPHRPVRHRVTITDLPVETLKHVFHFLDAKSLVRSEMVCPAWRECSRDDTYWADLCRSQYGISPENFKPAPDPVKLLFALTYGSLSMIKYGRPSELRCF